MNYRAGAPKFIWECEKNEYGLHAHRRTPIDHTRTRADGVNLIA